MQYPLYELYNHNILDLYGVREHYLENFYYQDHGRREADNVLRIVVNSSRIDRLLHESYINGIAPSYEDYLSIINSMLRFMFKSNDTQVLAVIDAAILWDIKINSKLHSLSFYELKQEIIKVFQKYQIYKEMSEEEFYSLQSPTVDMGFSEESSKLLSKNSWSLVAFSKQFSEMRVGEFVNSETGETFKSCVFSKGKDKTFVGFSSKLGELTPDEIEVMKNDLVVVKNDKGKYNLYKSRDNRWKKVNI